MPGPELPHEPDLETSFLPWPEYEDEDDDATLNKLEAKTAAIPSETDYRLIEDATAIAASVLNHERAKPEGERSQPVIDRAYELYRAGMTAN
jgi:hypothetical protein